MVNPVAIQGQQAVVQVERGYLGAFCESVKNIALSIIQAIGDILGKIFSCFAKRQEVEVAVPREEVKIEEGPQLDEPGEPAPPEVHLALPDPEPAPPAYEEPAAEYFLPTKPGDIATIRWKGQFITMAQLNEVFAISNGVKDDFEIAEKFLRKPFISADELIEARTSLSQAFSQVLGSLLDISGLGRNNSVFQRYSVLDTILDNQRKQFVDAPVQNLEDLFIEMEAILIKAPFNETREGVLYLGNNLHRFVDFDQQLEARQKYLETPKGIAEATAHRLKDKVKAAPVGSSLLATGAAGLFWAVVAGSPIGLAVGAVAAGVQAHRKGYIRWPHQNRNEMPNAGQQNLVQQPVQQLYVPAEPPVLPVEGDLGQYVPAAQNNYNV